jgi:hypothetical protein
MTTPSVRKDRSIPRNDHAFRENDRVNPRNDHPFRTEGPLDPMQ